MTPEQIEMLQLSLAQLGAGSRELAECFYACLFELAPSCRSMFSEDPADQEALFASELTMIVACVSEFEAFVPVPVASVPVTPSTASAKSITGRLLRR